MLVLGQNARADFTFGEPVNLGLALDHSDREFSPSISADGLSLYFLSDRPGGVGWLDIWVATRETIDGPWGEPVNLGPTINTPISEWGVSISYDGLSLYFDTSETGLMSINDLWIVTRATTDDDWNHPVSLGATVNRSMTDDFSPSISSDGLSLYFTSCPARGGHGGYDLWVATRGTTDSDWRSPVNLGPMVNSAHLDGTPGISADGRALFFVSRRPDGYGSDDIWVTMRETTDAPWEDAVNLGSIINSAESESWPNVSADGSTLFFNAYSSDVGGGLWQAPILPIVDFTRDNKVDTKDLTILIEHWGQNEPSVDIGPMPWGDGVVDAADLEVLMSYWGQEVYVYDPHLLAHWKLDETEGDVAYDSAAENDAVVMGDAVWQPEAGQNDGVLQFDGIDDYINTGLVLNPADGVFSVFAWIKSSVPDQVIFSQADGADWLLSDAQGYLMTNLVSAGRRSGGPLVSATIVADSNWHRVGFAWDGTDRILYIDDTEVARDTLGGLKGSDGGLYIGVGKGLEAGTFCSGLIDDVRIYDRVIVP